MVTKSQLGPLSKSLRAFSVLPRLAYDLCSAKSLLVSSLLLSHAQTLLEMASRNQNLTAMGPLRMQAPCHTPSPPSSRRE